MSWNLLWLRSTFKLPEEYREVLVKCGSVVALGYFDPSERRFILNDGSSLDCRHDAIEWMDFVTPEIMCGREIFYS
jgi:hypothetical protein